MSITNFKNAVPQQYPTGDNPCLVKFINSIYADTTTANAVKHVNFAPLDGKIGPISSLLEQFTWDSTMSPAVVKPYYHRALSEAAMQGLKENGFAKRLIFALQKEHKLGEKVDMNKIPKDQLFLLHTLAIAPCKKITMLTVPSKWYAHTSREFKAELAACLPELHVGIRTSNEKRTLVRIGCPESYVLSVPGESAQTLDENLMKRPRCLRCMEKKKSCSRRRPCDRCENSGIGFDGCIPEGEANRRNGFYGGRHTKGVRRKRNQTTEPDEDADGDNATNAIDQDHTLEQEIASNTDNNKDGVDRDEDHGKISLFEQIQEYLRNEDVMNEFLQLYNKFSTGQDRFEDMLDGAVAFFGWQNDIFTELKDYMRTEESRQKLNGAFKDYLLKRGDGERVRSMGSI